MTLHTLEGGLAHVGERLRALFKYATATTDLYFYLEFILDALFEIVLQTSIYLRSVML